VFLVRQKNDPSLDKQYEIDKKQSLMVEELQSTIKCIKNARILEKQIKVIQQAGANESHEIIAQFM